jgi:hypothetical protein
MEWLDANLYPLLRLDHASIKLTYQAVSPDQGPGPDIVTFKVECAARHSTTGSLVYTVDDLSFMPSEFFEFADALKGVLDGDVQEARLSPVGDELVVTVKRVGKDVWMHVEIKEWQAIYPETTASVSGGVGTDVAYRWARELKEYSERLSEWVLEKKAS